MFEFSVSTKLYLGKNGTNSVFFGDGVFRFNPNTRFNGSVYELRQSGTDGQYFLPDIKPHPLFSYTIPMGLHLLLKKYKDNSALSCEFGFRKTFTDYLDDVSTTYVDKTSLINSNGQLTANLADRSVPDIPGFSDMGAIRGNKENNDNYSKYCDQLLHSIGKIWKKILDKNTRGIENSQRWFFPGKILTNITQ
ncbi:MAG: hypothetical protein JNL57_01335 [Bacteroidetes bacterium]|nr:hypothetical protein [Bacteroidota bacterium]